jgi:hypothetical protein
MTIHLYLSLIPEALVASHLPPEEYGAYLALGPKKRSHGQAVFFKLSDAYAQEKLNAFPGITELKDGRLRRSAYLSIHRVLENTPLEAIDSLHLTTNDGHVLTLLPAEYKPDPGPRYHLYQEFCPVTPRVVSTLEPKEFAAEITDTTQAVSLPALAFAELILERLGDDPEAKRCGQLALWQHRTHAGLLEGTPGETNQVHQTGRPPSRTGCPLPHDPPRILRRRSGRRIPFLPDAIP